MKFTSPFIITFIAGFLFLAQNALADNPTTLLKYVKTGGFVAISTSQTVEIQSGGKVVSTITEGETTTTQDLAQLSDFALANLKKQISTVNGNAKLVDQDPTGPRCADLPDEQVLVTQGTQDILISENRMCHSFLLEDGSAGFLPQIIQVFVALSNN